MPLEAGGLRRKAELKSSWREVRGLILQMKVKNKGAREHPVPSLTFHGPTRQGRFISETPLFRSPDLLPAKRECPGWEGRAGLPTPLRLPVRPDAPPAWSGPCRPRVAAAGHARAPGGRGAALPTWTSSSGGRRGPAAGGGAVCGGCGGAGCACGWWCGCFSSSPEKSAASRAGFAAPSTGLSCANTGSSCGAGG